MNIKYLLGLVTQFEDRELFLGKLYKEIKVRDIESDGEILLVLGFINCVSQGKVLE